MSTLKLGDSVHFWVIANPCHRASLGLHVKCGKHVEAA